MSIKKIYLSLALLIFCLPALAQYEQYDWAPREHQIHFGIGPAFFYADNGGVYRQFDFSINPAISLGYSKKISRNMKIRATTGTQFLSSSKNVSPELAQKWADEGGHAYSMKGNAFFLDVMPEFYLYPSDRHLERKRINFFAGLGIGFLVVNRDQTVALTMEEQENEDLNEKKTNESNSTPYIPIRIGGFYAPSPHWDFGIEGNILTTFSDELDGNVGNNSTYDMLFQIQFTLRRYLSDLPFWRKNL